MIKKQILKNEAATVKLGERIAAFLALGDLVLLSGALGAGKTTLARGLIQKLAGGEENVPSPTFTLVQTYQTTPAVWHVDLYRLETAKEIMELGIMDALDEACLLIEWAEKMPAGLKLGLGCQRLEINLETSNDWVERIATLKAYGKKWEKFLNESN